jgi:hypothetical protein
MKEKQNQLIKYLESISYFFLWLFFLCILTKLGINLEQHIKEIINTSAIILILGIITKSVSWKIGHDSFGLSGDSKTRIINYHGNGNGDFWYDLFADDKELLKNKDIRNMVLTLSKKTEDHE